MLMDDLYKAYQLNAQQTFALDSYRAIVSGDQVFVIVPLEDHHHGSIVELVQMANHLRANGEYGVALPVLNQEKRYVSEIEKKQAVLYHCPDVLRKDRVPQLAGELAGFHLRGLRLGLRGSTESQYGAWAEAWAKRLDQLEYWRGTLMSRDSFTHFDERFLSTFPYFLGLAENAIQYAVDSRLDDRNQELQTICHHRFHPLSWDYTGFGPLKLPSEWVIDYPVRDLAEWIRFNEWMEGEDSLNGAITFLVQYQNLNALSDQALRLLYARVLYPIVYIETVEGYYSSQYDEEKAAYTKQLERIVERSSSHESFLRAFQERVGERLPKVDWLS